MLCVVTGAGGHVGSNLVPALLAEGRSVRVADLHEPTGLVRLGAEFVPCDVRDRAAVSSALADAETVFHLAAVISVVGSMGDLVRSVNVDGVRIVAEEAHRAGVRRFVHCSSVHAFDLFGARGHVVNEGTRRAVDPRLPAYDRSKAAGEAQLQRVVAAGLDAVIVNPTGVVGPRDEQPSRMGHFFRALAAHRLPATVAGAFDWVDVRDVVQRAAVRGGERTHGRELPRRRPPPLDSRARPHRGGRHGRSGAEDPGAALVRPGMVAGRDLVCSIG